MPPLDPKLRDATARLFMSRVESWGKTLRAMADIADQMATYGITRVPVDYFHVGKYRYTNLDDAIAEAKRQQPAAKV